MREVFDRLTGVVRHNPRTTMAVVLLVGLLVVGWGCQPTAVNPVTGESMTRPELQAWAVREATDLRGDAAEAVAELAALQAEAQADIERARGRVQALTGRIEAIPQTIAPALQDIERQETALDAAFAMATAGLAEVPGPWAPIVAGGLTIAGLLLGRGDKRQADQVILERKEEIAKLEAERDRLIGTLDAMSEPVPLQLAETVAPTPVPVSSREPSPVPAQS